MSWHQSKSFPADVVFSKIIRSKHKKCQMCGRRGTGSDEVFGLQASHYFSRGKWNTRYDEENVDVLCISCHQKTHKDKPMYEFWKIAQLGQTAFELLTLRANSRSQMGSNYWKKLTKKQAENIFHLSAISNHGL